MGGHVCVNVCILLTTQLLEMEAPHPSAWINHLSGEVLCHLQQQPQPGLSELAVPKKQDLLYYYILTSSIFT